MIYQERLLKILNFPHISEKSSVVLEKYNTVVFKVRQFSTKSDIKNAICVLFSVKVKHINIVIVSGKMKGSVKNYVGRRNTWKKAYVVLEKGYKIDLIKNEIKYLR